VCATDDKYSIFTTELKLVEIVADAVVSATMCFRLAVYEYTKMRHFRLRSLAAN